MAATITVTNALARMDAIVFQIDYALRHVGQISDESFIRNFIGTIRNQYIHTLKFYVLQSGKADPYLEINVDWGIHGDLINKGQLVDARYLDNNISREIITEAQAFSNKVHGKGIDFAWTYSKKAQGMENKLGQVLNSAPADPFEIAGMIGNYNLKDIPEMGIRKNVNY
ncbi:MAG: hypothetical protein FWG64_02990 [Firmicutes bacterium]|nr:hypothetical protein [Bacillota bacterium]